MGDNGHLDGEQARRAPPAPLGLVRQDTSADDEVDLLAAVAASSLLPTVSASGFEDLRPHLRLVTLRAGDTLFERGDESADAFVVIDGVLEAGIVTMHGHQQLSLMRPGDVIGEIGVLVGDARSTTVRALADTRLAMVPGERLRSLLDEHPAAAEDLARRATERLRRGQLVEYFSNTFGVFDLDVLNEVQELLSWVSVPAGARLFSQGDEGDAAYLVATGRLRVMRRGDNGAEVAVGEIGRAELVGEMALIDGEPRTSSVDAVRDTQLVRFSKAVYDEVLGRYPRVGLEIAKIAMRRSRSGPRSGRDVVERRSFTIVPISPGIDADGFSRQLGQALGAECAVIGSADIDAALGRPGISQIDDDDVGSLRLAYRLEELEARHRFILYRIDESWTPWSRRALRWSDHVVLVADARADPAPDELERELWSLVTRQFHSKVSLVLVHPPDTKLPQRTPAWLEPRSLASHHHVRTGDASHLARLARILSGRATAVVLGGGGARGFAHLGVLQVLDELNIPLDMIGGTSIGSIMGIGPAMGWTAAFARTKAVEQFTDLFDYTLPATSLLKGRKITDKIAAQIGDVDIADLWVPYFCASTNLTHARSKYHDRGPFVAAIRASIAIPGILPPVPHGRDLLVDGGVLDNVPVSEMRRRNPTGTVIAVDVASPDGPEASHDYGLSVSGFSRIFRRRRGGPPNLVSVMVRSSLLASVRDRRRVIEDGVADLYLDVAVDGGDMLDFSRAAEIVEQGAAASRPLIQEWRTAPVAAPTYVHAAPARIPIIEQGRRRRRRPGAGALLLTRRDLRYRLSRFASVIAGVSVVFTLLFLMTGLTEQFHREPRDAAAAFGAEGWLVREGASGAFTSAATMPADTAAEVGGTEADPVVIGRHGLSGGADPIDAVVVGFREGGLGSPRVADGRAPTAPTEVVVDESAGLDLGDEARLGDRPYRVVGHTERTTLFAGMPLVHMDIGAAQALLYRGQDLASAVLLAGSPGSVPDGFSVLTSEEVAEDALRPLERSISSVNLIRVLLWFVAAMIIGTMVYLSALERRRDVAVLKAIGAPTSVLGASIAMQGVLIALVAAAIASVLQVVAVPVFPLAVSVPSRAFVQVPALAVVVSLLAGGVGLRRAVSTDPALAFSGAGS